MKFLSDEQVKCLSEETKLLKKIEFRVEWVNKQIDPQQILSKKARLAGYCSSTWSYRNLFQTHA